MDCVLSRMGACEAAKDNRRHALFLPAQTRFRAAAQGRGVRAHCVIILLAPYIARSPDVREMMAQGHVVGWFALVLGCAFLARYGLIRWRGRR